MKIKSSCLQELLCCKKKNILRVKGPFCHYLTPCLPPTHSTLYTCFIICKMGPIIADLLTSQGCCVDPKKNPDLLPSCPWCPSLPPSNTLSFLHLFIHSFIHSLIQYVLYLPRVTYILYLSLAKWKIYVGRIGEGKQRCTTDYKRPIEGRKMKWLKA